AAVRRPQRARRRRHHVAGTRCARQESQLGAAGDGDRGIARVSRPQRGGGTSSGESISSKPLSVPFSIRFFPSFRRHVPPTFSTHVTLHQSRLAAGVKGFLPTLTSMVSVAFSM